MAMKCCTKLETAKERCPIVFQGHPSNFKVTQYKTSPIFTQIGRFWTIGRSQLSNPSDLPCCLTCLTLRILLIIWCQFVGIWHAETFTKNFSKPPYYKHMIYHLIILIQWHHTFLAATKQLYEWFSPSVCLSVRPSVRLSVCHTFLTMFQSSHHHEIFRSYYQWQKWRPCKRSRSEVKGQGHRGHDPT